MKTSSIFVFYSLRLWTDLQCVGLLYTPMQKLSVNAYCLCTLFVLNSRPMSLTTLSRNTDSQHTETCLLVLEL